MSYSDSRGGRHDSLAAARIADSQYKQERALKNSAKASEKIAEIKRKDFELKSKLIKKELRANKKREEQDTNHRQESLRLEKKQIRESLEIQQKEAKQRLRLQEDEAKQRLALQNDEAMENARLRAYEKDLLWLSNCNDIEKIEYLYNKNSDELNQHFLNNIVDGNIDLGANTLVHLSEIRNDLEEVSTILGHIEHKKAQINSGIGKIKELDSSIKEEHKRTLGEAIEFGFRSLLATITFNIILPPCFVLYLFIAFDLGFIQSLFIGIISPPLVWYIIKKIPFVRDQVIQKKISERATISTKSEILSKEINAHNDELENYFLAIRSNLSNVESFEVSSEQLAKLTSPTILRSLLDSLLYNVFEPYPPNHKIKISSFTDDEIFLVYHKIIINRFNNYCVKLIKDFKKEYSALGSHYEKGLATTLIEVGRTSVTPPPLP